MKIILFFLVSLSCFSKTFEINSQHSFVKFELDYMGVSRVSGEFKKFLGTFDYQDGKISNLEFRIDPKSIDTSDKKRDRHLKTNDFFHVQKYRTIDFKNVSVKYKDGKPISLNGDLTLLNQTKRVKFKTEFKGLLADPFDKKKRSFFLEARGQINRKDFGLTWNKAIDKGGYVVGNLVDIRLIIEANPTDNRGAFSRFMRPQRRGKSPVNLNLPPSKTSEVKDISKKKVSITSQNDSPKITTGETGLGTVLNLTIGFVLFILLIITSYFSKKWTERILSKTKLNELSIELISDSVMFLVVVGGAAITAPLMGYGDNPLEKLFQ